ncbi:MAG: hypothetical protein AAF747_10880 [Planctomycetota bacterium]
MNRAAFALVSTAALTASAVAGGDGDVGFRFLDGSVITTIALDDQFDTEAAFPEGFEVERVFGVDFDSTGAVDEPGFYINSFSRIPGLRDLSLTYTQQPLRVFDGTDFVATDHTLTQINGIPGVNEISSPTTGTSGGWVFPISVPTSGPFEFDNHPDFQLDNGSDALVAGAYLWEIEFNFIDASDNVVFSTDSVGLVFNFGLSEEDHDEAIEAAEAIIPTPGAAAVLAMAGIGASRRRR